MKNIHHDWIQPDPERKPLKPLWIFCIEDKTTWKYIDVYITSKVLDKRDKHGRKIVVKTANWILNPKFAYKQIKTIG